MSKRNHGRKMGICTCDNCGVEFTKPQSEINRNLKIGRRNFCTRSCSGMGNFKNFEFSVELNHHDLYFWGFKK